MGDGVRAQRKARWTAGGHAALLALALAVPATHALALPPPEALLPRAKPVATPEFISWVSALREEALGAGISATTFDRAFTGILPDPVILERDAHQPEFARPIWEYLDGAVSDLRVENGRAAQARLLAELQRLELLYGVPKQILVAIWGLESSYGNFTGDTNIIQSLATLTFAGRRTDYFRGELINALKILEARGGSVLLGSWAGAMGHTQFMPSSYLAHAVDGDDDGERDIWDNPVDALASTASYLQQSGWEPGKSWGEAVRLPERFDYALAELTLQRPMSEWAGLGVTRLDGSMLELTGAQGRDPSAILVPAGHEGMAFIVGTNFRALLAYNNSTAYALGIGLLSDRIAGAHPLPARWPRDTRPLTRTEREELQRHLLAEGQPVGEVDGVIGIRTREAIRVVQQRLGLVPDGFPDDTLLARLRARADERGGGP
ncbi:MAG: lytic murein transglycosylase [Alphaproteobacteria bacterium]|nr:lytic murein transglycosylase [Alphaproteobacteria bacterium]